MNDFKLLKVLETKRPEILKLIESHDKARTKRKAIDLAGFFRELERIVGSSDMQDFHKWLQDIDNIPFEYGNLEELTADRFDFLLQAWHNQRQQQIRSVASSEVFTEEAEPIVAQTEDLMKKRHEAIKQYMNSLPDKGRLGDYNVNQLLKEILGDNYLYEYNADFEHFFDKTGSYVALLQVVKGYRNSERSIVPADDEKYIYPKEMPYILAYWHKTNPELTIQPHRRKQHKEVQTDLPMRGSGSKDISLETILNMTIDQLKNKKNQTDNNEWLESIDYLIITLRKERNRLYPQYRPKNMKLFTEPSILEMSKIDKKEAQKARADVLKEIYDHYLEKNQQPVNNGELSTRTIYGFLQEIGVGQNQITKKRTLSIIDARLKDQDAMSFTQFVSLINELVPLEQSKLSQMNLQAFTNEIRAAKFLQKTIKVSKRYERQKMITIATGSRSSHHKQPLGLKTPSIHRSPAQELQPRGNSLLMNNNKKKKSHVFLEEIYRSRKSGEMSPQRNQVGVHSMEIAQSREALKSPVQQQGREVVFEHQNKKKKHRYKGYRRI